MNLNNRSFKYFVQSQGESIPNELSGEKIFRMLANLDIFKARGI
jgi:hypothetical protein